MKQTADPVARLLADPPDLPVVAALPRLRALVTTRTDAAPATPAPAVVVTAPPGTGKTTLLPPLVADVLARPDGAGAPRERTPRRVIVTQPRRVATRAAARRLASLLGEEVGGTVGYAVRGERRASARTRIEVVTAGLLLRRLQGDPELPDVAAVVLDEVHERSLESDLLLALLLDARAALREDLAIVAMSATLDLQRLPALLGDGLAPAPVVEVPGALHPLDEVWAPPPSGVSRLGPRGVPREFLAHMAATVRRALAEREGDVLVFLPGAREVDDVVARLRESLRYDDASPDSGPGGPTPATIQVLPLHGRLPGPAQDAALSPSPGTRRVIVSTDVAESSLTVPGVRIVVDATLAREPRLDVARGMSGLVTVGASRAAGIQRAGRAARTGPGAVYRCCTPVDWARAAAAPLPKILTADLTRTALELAVWGVPAGKGLAWLDPPPAPALDAARLVLTRLGLLDGDAVTELGRAVAAVPAPVRPARALLAAADVVGLRQAAEATALLTGDLRAPRADLSALARNVRGGTGAAAWRAEARRLEHAARRHPAGGHAASPDATSTGPRPGAAGGGVGVNPADVPITGLGELVGPGAADAVGLVVALAHPEWLARRRGPAPAAGRPAAYASVGGTGMRLPVDSPLAAAEWLAIAEVDRAPGAGEATIRAAAPVDETLALTVADSWLAEETLTTWDADRLRAQRVRRLGAIVLVSSTAKAPAPDQVAQAVVERCRAEGIGALPWRGAAVLRARLALLHRTLGEPWPDVGEAALLERAPQWLVPGVEALAATSGGRFDLGRLDVTACLRSLLPWPEAARLDELAPERLEVPSGSQVRVDYLDEQGEALERPVLAVRVQECFGWADTPRIADGRVGVVIHLLSPARRPVAITDDLRSFWRQGYPQVRSDMRGRYPKHAWPEDPWTAPATRGTGRRRRG
ncbi:ATP-dependent RNA helicase [Actinomyces sp.]|uniref:ATP-dependent RNA helicase n=1 Tax=Actinomyces sp. TaxID=29317 RepID=UPI0026DD014B|nr:ATP-dependent helicase C-terminal domain-containing protein [Actinomyces sp.]MDO4900469.1 ATP-dependent helicase C-terminal domain-containing protein [Actinomyces sp.]